MGTGSSGKGTSGKRGSNAKKPPEWTPRNELTAQDGSKIDLSANPLRYGASAMLNDRERQTVDRFESKRAGNKIEFGTLIGANGEVLIESKGGKGSVKLPTRLYDQASVMSHNHPRGNDKGKDVGMLGGTFSGADINAFTSTNVRTMRAAAHEGTYSIQKGAKFNAAGLTKHFADSEKTLRAAYQKRLDAAQTAIKNVVQRYNHGQATYDEWKTAYNRYEKEKKDAFNSYLVGSHNALISGQKQYGYTYTLERRK